MNHREVTASERPIDQVEGLFSYACELHRLARKGGHPSVNDVRTEINVRLQEAQREADASGPEFKRFLTEIKVPLCCFLDYMVETTSDRALSEAWRPHRLTRTASAGAGSASDTAFFESHLDVDLAAAESEREETAEAERRRERLRFYYRCLLLGFQGQYDVQNAENDETAVANEAKLEDYRTRLARVLRLEESAEARRRVTPEAGESVCDSRLDLDQAPAFWGMVAILVLFFALFLGFSGWMYAEGSSRLTSAVESLERSLQLKP